MNLPQKINIIEVGPRDGLQNHDRSFSLDEKLSMIANLYDAGLREIEVGALVNPKAVPKMADSEELIGRLKNHVGFNGFSVLVPNLKGFEIADRLGVQRIAVFTAASESFNQHNIKASITQSFERFEPILPLAQKQKMKVRGYVSTAFYCPYEGKISPDQVLPVVQKLFDLGVDEVSIGDTIGKATVQQVRVLLESLLKYFSPQMLAMHFHDTFGNAMQNVLASLEFGISRFDASVDGIGGCPYAPGASGNISTNDIVRELHAQGFDVDVDLEKLQKIKMR